MSLTTSTPRPDSAAYPDEAIAEGSVVDGEKLTSDIEETFDYVVVGSGAAGAVAAHTIARSGASIALVEEGPWAKTRQFGERVYAAFQRMFRDAGTQVIEGRSYIPIIQGRCVGGSTVVNSAIVHRLPDEVMCDWARHFDVGDAINARVLEPHFDALERDLNAHAVLDEALGASSQMFLREAGVHGIPAERTHRFERGCMGSARCFQGCPHGAKQGMNVTYVPWALALGARLFCSARVERILVERGRASGILARTQPANGDPDAPPSRKVTLHARKGVLVAASAVQTPNLLRRSGLRSRALGAHFQCHPGFGIGGVFDAPVTMGFGATQGAESMHLRGYDKIKLETLAMPPELAAVRIPGIGAELMGRLGAFSNLAVWAVIVRAEAEGVVRSSWGGGDRVVWTPSSLDVARVRKGVALLARMMFEAGAREVWPGIHGVPSTLRRVDEVRLIEQVALDPRLFGFITTHLFGSARMGRDPRASVVGTDFQAHELAGLYVLDSSVFPTNLGVNPQHSIMAMSRLAATRILARDASTDLAA